MSASARPSSSDNGGDASEGVRSPRGVCPDCNRSFKDLKAHTFTHARERPEKCPIKACEYHVRGFSRKHDRNRHALNHYRGTLICGFCPGLGSPAEISFNRLDLFRKHVVEIHGVPKKPPNGPRLPGTRSGVEAVGDCNICGQTFLSPDDLYDHLDDCVLSVLNEEDPAGAINEKLLAEVATCSPELYQGEPPPITGRENNLHMDARRSSNSFSPSDTRNRRNRGHYPAAWGFDDSQLSLKKRVTAVFNGPIRLARDEVLLSRDLEIRLKLSDGVSYVTDLDVMTLNRAEAIFAWPEEAALSATQQVPQTSHMGD
ncbi:hypothetical protein BGZ61DRAFT_373144 [Ilyonectria robusta]|uniref:uncharacterized protein n=1 Tax=Ilyonectria robusta TaxID=1079257 RepID=UPI001E8E2161|nr:uncharacterized protein BGZ61DRAFT_373144 [Ilyonectria robusta]KAH8654799.1 hypothetical protein BGZ61DRAFT_373144 [Ilyonectria robusta]